ncbi:metallophosphoesterase family protein [Selenihalanaerobacter shriftii]|uniref:DNA repair exonuclease SbcCD nuclease subunit n=1 Tax=Selenihalanaerobacter shriftii TaxID=142842 RepID=A0A1T4K662_9FIRM|nr:DNA repair exonuclease [Selenihalanaerobacter shriftii]SJZ37817.1 DNA repair exonuclease SbcCD nuclease subunit [Selenihalanaerobacter shriftii]
MFKFIHTADLHLGSPFKGIENVSEELQQRLYDSTYQAFKNVVDLALAEEVDFILIAGDLYDVADKNIRAQVFCQRELSRLADKGIHTFIVHGNHDHCSGWRAELTWSEEVHFFNAGQVDNIPFSKEGIEVAKIHGISYPQQNVNDNYFKKFKVRDESLYQIGVLHTNVDGKNDYQNYAPCRLNDLVRSNFDYWALGHIHQKNILNEIQPTIIYPGNIQGRHPKETGSKGCYVVEVSDNGKTEYEFISTDVVRWYYEELDITDVENEEILLNRLEERIDKIKSENISGIIRFKLQGRTLLHHKLKVDGYIEEIVQLLRSHWQQGKKFYWVDSIKVETGPKLNKERIRNEETLVGDFLNLAQQSKKDETLFTELRGAISPVYEEDNRASKVLRGLSDDRLKELIKQAEDLGLDLLLGKEG